MFYKAKNEPVWLHKPGSDERKKLDLALSSMQSEAPFNVPICIGSEELSSSQPKKQVLVIYWFF